MTASCAVMGSDREGHHSEATHKHEHTHTQSHKHICTHTHCHRKQCKLLQTKWVNTYWAQAQLRRWPAEAMHSHECMHDPPHQPVLRGIYEDTPSHMQPPQSGWLDPIWYDLDSRVRERELVRVRQGGKGGMCREKGCLGPDACCRYWREIRWPWANID